MGVRKYDCIAWSGRVSNRAVVADDRQHSGLESDERVTRLRLSYSRHARTVVPPKMACWRIVGADSE